MATTRTRLFKRAALSFCLGLCLALGLMASSGAPAAWGQEKQEAKPLVAAKPYHGNVKTKKFHRHGCRYYSCRNCLANFKTREQAIKAGYYPCKVCNP